MSRELPSELGFSMYKEQMPKTLLSADQEKELALSIAHGRIADALLQLRNTSSVAIRQKGKARIDPTVALNLLTKFGLTENVDITYYIEPKKPEKKGKETRTADAPAEMVDVIQAIHARGSIVWPKESIDQLQKVKEEAKKAQELLINFNLRLAFSIALTYFKKGLTPLQDAVQNGNIGLMIATLKFEPFRDHKFSTVATPWIHLAIKRAIDNTEDIIRIPVSISADYARIQKIRTSFQQKEDREPTIEEIAERLAKTPQYVEIILNAKEISKPGSLDTLLNRGNEDGPDTDFSLNNVLPDTIETSPSEAAERSDLRRRIWAILDKLGQISPRYAKYLRARFGFCGPEQNQKDLVDRFNVRTPQGISALEKSALEAFARLAKEDVGLMDLVSNSP